MTLEEGQAIPTFPPINPRAPFIWHGGDYNPEQWPRAIWDEDVRLMQECHYNIATVGVFSWVNLQPDEEHFTFEWLDDILDKMTASGRVICLATPTAAQPAWMSQKYPDVMRADANGVRRHHGGRTNYCPGSPTYRHFAQQIAGRLAERYHAHPALVIWHISNEYNGACYCDTCAATFRTWLQQRYGSLEQLNKSYWADFWGHTYTDWEQVQPPYENGERSIHGLTIDYRRFQNEMMLQCFQLERDAIRAFSPDIPITTNLMGTYFDLDYRTWGQAMDVVSWDSYPRPNDSPANIAFVHDLNRGLRDGQPFILMEQTPSSQNWQPINALKRPGVLRLWSYQAIAHGAETVMYFQWRRGRGGVEKMHGAVVEHSGRTDARVFQEVKALGTELERLGKTTLGATTPARVAIMFDWNSWWGLNSSVGPVREKEYLPVVRQHYSALWQRNVSVDIVFNDSDLSRYSIVVAPMLYMVRPGVAERIEAFVRQGGTFVATYLSGIVDEHDLAFEEGYPGPLKNVLGIWNEEIDALYPEQSNQIVMRDQSGIYTCGRLCEIIHCEGAEALASYGSDFYAGTPVVTRNTFGKGTGYYIASEPEQRFLNDFYTRLLEEQGIQPLLETPEGIEVTRRVTEQGPLLFLLNHNEENIRVKLRDAKSYHDLIANQTVNGSITLAGRGVAILREE
jgi:beta-galactosidase